MKTSHKLGLITLAVNLFAAAPALAEEIGTNPRFSVTMTLANGSPRVAVPHAVPATTNRVLKTRTVKTGKIYSRRIPRTDLTLAWMK